MLRALFAVAVVGALLPLGVVRRGASLSHRAVDRTATVTTARHHPFPIFHRRAAVAVYCPPAAFVVPTPAPTPTPKKK